MTAKTNYTTIEAIIEERIAELEKDYELDRYDITQIREEAYRENGWSYDPFPLEDDKEEDNEEEEYRFHDIYDDLREVGMSIRDFL